MSSSEKLAILRRRQSELVAQIAQVEAVENAKRRREDTRLKILLGAAIIADTNIHPETLGTVLPILRRAIKLPRDVELLQKRGFL